MKLDRLHAQGITRRLLLLGGLKLGLFSVLGLRLHYLQLVEGQAYRDLAEGNRVRIFPNVPLRARILDREGAVLAGSSPRYQVVYETAQGLQQEKSRAREILRQAAEILELEPAAYRALLEAFIAREQWLDPLVLAEDVSWEKVAALEARATQLPGIRVMTAQIRRYPLGKHAAHVTGYVGRANEEEMQSSKVPSAVFRYPEFKIGKTGAERALEDQLLGVPGYRQIEVDARGHYVKELKQDEGRMGEDVQVTLHAALQKKVGEILTGKGGLQGESASAVVMDAYTGEVLAMVSVPSFDPERFAQGRVTNRYMGQLNSNPDRPFVSKAFSSHYPPGSTFKVLVTLAALESGVVDGDTEIFCPGHVDFGGRRYHCWHRAGHGNLNAAEALQKSCNVYFYRVAQKLGIGRITAMAHRFGLGEVTGLPLPGERPGLVPTRAWKKATLGQPWYEGETLSVSIGQSYTTTTPLQLAMMTARLVTNQKVVPQLIKHPGYAAPVYEPMGLNETHRKIVMQGMDMVVNEREGSVYPHRVTDPNLAFAGKTGTAQVVASHGDRKPKNPSERYHALFIGYTPTDKPRYVTSVVVEHGGYGALVAAPLGKEILLATQQYMQGKRGAQGSADA